MSRPTPQTRSLTEVPGWLEKVCERCGATFWSVPSQAKFTRFCAKDCRNEPASVRLWKNTIVRGPEDCWNCTLTPTSEYPTIKVAGVQIRASRLSLELHLGRLLGDGLYALHSCDNTKCVNPAHLREGTTQDNVDDRQERKRSKVGVEHGQAKLSVEQIVEIKKLKGTMILREAAESFNVGKTTIHDIWKGKRHPDI